MDDFHHISVLSDELIASLSIRAGDTVVDCTCGGGGHASKILEKLGPSGRLIAFDRDPQAIAHLQTKFADELKSGRLLLIQSPYSHLKSELAQHSVGKIDKICADIGISSPQIDQAERGFSFQSDGPLDMRMDQTQAKSAEAVVNEYDYAELKKIIASLGEEPKAHFVAEAIVKARQESPIRTTRQLAEIVSNSIHYRTRSKKNPATKTFQALRIYVNDELGELHQLCEDGFELLSSTGRFAIISFHSLEDKIVKDSFKLLGRGKPLPSHISRAPVSEAVIDELKDIKAKIIKPFPITAGKQELDFNPRARSAKLRVIEKL